MAIVQQQGTFTKSIEEYERSLNLSNMAMLAALFLAIWFATQSDPSKQQDRRTKARQRILDAMLLALLLRFLASLLRALTSSYSSDTVQRLAWGSMGLHVVACDYSYANGRGGAPSTHQRPPFAGGTLALNAALFSTTLLNSRLSSNSAAYAFSCMAIVLFAFYSATRHAIAASYPSQESIALWLITASIIMATCCLLVEDEDSFRAFLALVVLLGGGIPAWKYMLQNTKLWIHGPWDIPTMEQLHSVSTENEGKR